MRVTDVAEIRYTTVNGQKRYYTGNTTNLHVVQVAAPDGQARTLLARSPNDCDVKEGATSDSVFVSGKTGTLTTNTNATTSFAKSLASSGRGVFYSESTAQPVFFEGTFLVNFDKTQTIRSNQSKETQAEAQARLAAYVESLGYSKVSEARAFVSE